MATAPNKQNRQRIVLPFEKRKTDIATWAYDHRVGLLVTVVAYLLLAIAFVSSKIIINNRTPVTIMYLDLQELPQERPQPEDITPQERQMLEEALRNVRNVASNESAWDNADPQRARQSLPSDVSSAVNELGDRLQANSDAYAQSLRDIENMGTERDRTESRTEGKSESRQDIRQAGNVTVSYDLGGRNAVHLPIPAYRCEGAGQVVVSISVNRNGDVTNASIQSMTSSDQCLKDRALEAAKRSRFAVDASAPASQKGTITYLFIRQ